MTLDKQNLDACKRAWRKRIRSTLRLSIVAEFLVVLVVVPVICWSAWRMHESRPVMACVLTVMATGMATLCVHEIRRDLKQLKEWR